jgi:hypothetical protein
MMSVLLVDADTKLNCILHGKDAEYFFSISMNDLAISPSDALLAIQERLAALRICAEEG